MADETWLDDLLGYKRLRSDTGDGGYAELPRRAAVGFTGSGVAVTDDPARNMTLVTIAASGGGGGGESGTTSVLTAVRVATSAPHTLSGLSSIDETSINDGDRVLVRAQLDPAENGIYLAHPTAWTRAPDTLVGMAMVGVNLGAYADSVWMLTTDDPIVLDVSPLNWQKVGSGDAESLRGVALAAGVGTPTLGHVLRYDGTEYAAALVDNASVAPSAAIAVTKLAPANSNGLVLRTVAGNVGWTAITSGDIAESVVTAAPIPGDQDNYSPAGWSTATLVRISASGPGLSIRGFGAASVKRKTVLNVGAETIPLKHNQGGQAAGNKIYTSSGGDFELGIGESATVVYDSADSAWRVLHKHAPGAVVYPTVANTWTEPQTFQDPLTLQPGSHVVFSAARQFVELIHPTPQPGWEVTDVPDTHGVRCFTPLKPYVVQLPVPIGATLTGMATNLFQSSALTGVTDMRLEVRVVTPTFGGGPNVTSGTGARFVLTQGVWVNVSTPDAFVPTERTATNLFLLKVYSSNGASIGEPDFLSAIQYVYTTTRATAQ